LFRRRSADTTTPRVLPSFSSSFDLEDYKGHSRVVESVEGETEEKESEEAMDKKGALERLENFKDIALEKLTSKIFHSRYCFCDHTKK
jgi:hypothetical protein